ncbi:immunoglobulin superfamily member 11-like isoform X2 [Acipenser ruthenus]|uniref:immunoglobulin superfamily member 11-like isoform X2 n=1 Tax=Acipenser ruthenus TaxID=7906 RepID=UPI00274069CD|nr:immunoglobulin superfamily member 11-like isoform X2 [Acipenser ruthenus]
MEGLGLCVITLLISSAFQKAHPVRVTVRETSVQVLRGDSVLLPCSFVTMATLSRLNIIWTVTPLSEPSSPSQVIVYDRGQVIESPSLIGRVSFRSVPLSADIVLNSTRLSDAGTYRCVVNNPPEPGAPGIGELSLTILAPPSSPLCLWDGQADEGGSISLSCSVEEGVPVPELHWDKLEPDQIALPVNKEGSLKGTVRILNISAQNSGLYRCTVSNPLGTEACSVALSVYSTSHGAAGILQAVSLTLCMALVLLALLALVLWFHRSGHDRKWREEGEEEECYNEIRYTPELLRKSFV